MKLSVLMPVYGGESPRFLRESLDSLTAQTRPADEVVIVEDGPLDERLGETIRRFTIRLPIVLLRLPVNVGLGSALRAGLEECRGEFVARMDSDDICIPERFERQMNFLEKNPQVDVLGSAIAEFRETPDALDSIRRLPSSGEELLRFATFRNPLNHMTVVFRRQAVRRAGSYQPCAGFEDYHLWVRMMQLGFCLHNMPEVLVHVRCGNGMQRRRGGLAYLKRELAFQTFLYRRGLLAASAYVRNILIRAPIRIAPAFVRSFCYSLFLRNSVPARGEFDSE